MSINGIIPGPSPGFIRAREGFEWGWTTGTEWFDTGNVCPSDLSPVRKTKADARAWTIEFFSCFLTSKKVLNMIRGHKNGFVPSI